MELSKIDPNFSPRKINVDEYDWYQITDDSFSLYGVFFNEETNCFVRMPCDVAAAINDGVPFLNKLTAGGRVRFATDSRYIAIQAAIPTDHGPMTHMPFTGSHCFGIYVNGEFSASTQFDAMSFTKTCISGNPTYFYDDLRALKPDGDGFQDWKATTADGFRECEITFPLYGGVRNLIIGVNKGSKIRKAKPYTYQKPVLFYGSSITQGGCASHPGAEHVGAVCRWLNADHINLGFSGSARAEPAIREYLASLDPSVYVLDYDHNAPNVEYLNETHYPLYQAIRKAHAKTPIVFITKPDFDGDPNSAKRRAVIYETYCKAKANGDDLVWFIDGETMFDIIGRSDCTVDTCHPNDLGFHRMATHIYPILKDALSKA